MRISLAQLAAQKGVGENLTKMRAAVDAAAGAGTDMVVLPEHFALRETDKPRRRAEAEEIPGGRILNALQEAAQANKVWIHGGSFAQKLGDEYFNTTAVVDPDGRLVETYQKIHLFDYLAPDGTKYFESSMNAPGTRIATYEAGGLIFGCAVCYDLRFLDRFMALARAGADVLMVPACFTLNTTRDHWDKLLQARAIDTQCYVIGVNQFGTFPDGSRPTGGRSMIVDPWGQPTLIAPDEVGW